MLHAEDYEYLLSLCRNEDERTACLNSWIAADGRVDKAEAALRKFRKKLKNAAYRRRPRAVSLRVEPPDLSTDPTANDLFDGLTTEQIQLVKLRAAGYTWQEMSKLLKIPRTTLQDRFDSIRL